MISPYLTRSIPAPHPPWKTKGDPQRSRVYMMERRFMGVCLYHTVTMADLRTVANHVCRYYKVQPVRIESYGDPTGCMAECVWSGDEVDYYVCYKIRLNRAKHGVNVACLLHELAHHVVHSTYKNVESHGPEFVAVYMHLFDKYKIMPSCAFRALAQKCKVKIAKRFKPGAIRA